MNPKLRQSAAVCSLAAALALAAAARCDWARAGITIAAPTFSLPYSASPQTGSFEVVVQNTGAGQAISASAVDLQMGASIPGFSFTSVGVTTATPYLFPGSSPAGSILGAGQAFETQDFAPSSDPTLGTGASAGMVKANFSLAAGATGQFPLVLIRTDPAASDLGTYVADSSGSILPSTLVNGLLIIQAPAAYWQGAVDGNWSTDNLSTGATNWRSAASSGSDTHIAPGTATDVFFSSTGASHLATALDADFSIKGLTFTASAAAVTIGGAHSLTIGVDGLTVQAGAAAHAIQTPVSVAALQTWTIAGAISNPLTLSGKLTVAPAQTLTKMGSGELLITSPPELDAGSKLAVSQGVLKLQSASGAASINSGATVTVAPGATLELAGTVPSLATAAVHVAIINDSQIGIVVDAGAKEQVGAITGAGVTTIQAGGQLTADSIRQLSLVIGGTSQSHSLLTLAPSNATGQPLSSMAGMSWAAARLAVPSSGAGSVSLSTGAGVTAIPEPTAILLALLGCLGLGRSLLRRR